MAVEEVGDHAGMTMGLRLVGGLGHRNGFDRPRRSLPSPATACASKLVRAVPEQRALGADDPPLAFPAGIGALGAPGAAIGEDDVVREFEDRVGRRAMRDTRSRADCSRGNRRPPAPCPATKRAASNVWIAMSSSSTLSISSRKPPKCAPMKKSQWMAGQFAERAAFDKPADAANAGDEAAVLDDGMDFVRRRRPGRSAHAPSSIEAAIGFSLSTWQPCASAGRDDIVAGGRDDDVEDACRPTVSASTAPRSEPMTASARPNSSASAFAAAGLTIDEADDINRRSEFQGYPRSPSASLWPWLRTRTELHAKWDSPPRSLRFSLLFGHRKRLRYYDRFLKRVNR